MKDFEKENNSQNKIEININTNTSMEEIINQACRLHSQGNIQEAIKYYQYVIKENCNNCSVFLNYAVILIDYGNLEEAEKFTRKAIELSPNSVVGYSNLCNILTDLGKLEEAEKYARKAIELNPSFATAYVNLANVLQNFDKRKEAEKYARKALELNPSSALCYLTLGLILCDLGQLEEAEKITRMSEEFKPNLGRYYYTLSKIYSEQDNIKEAISQINKAIDNDPKEYLKGELTRLRCLAGEFKEKDMSNKPWSNKDDYIYEDNMQEKLIVVFGSCGRIDSEINSFDFYNLLKKETRFDKLFIRDINKKYYLKGLKNSTSTIEETIQLINKLISKKKYKKIVSIGSSAGAFAAILFGNLFKFNKVVAFNPQTIISELHDKEITPFIFLKDLSVEFNNMKNQSKFFQKCLDLRNFIPFTTQVDIHFSNFSLIDKKQAMFIEHENCKLIKHNSGGHLLVIELKEKGLLTDLILSSLDLKT